MTDLVEVHEKPAPDRPMIAGWHQWADAGETSSGLPQYLVDNMQGRKIGGIDPDSFYLFQIPGTHHLLRPEVRLSDGHIEELRDRRNEFYYAGGDEDGFLIFIGEEPHRNEDEYARAFFDAVEALDVDKVAAVAGVHGPVPYDKDREISCIYSLPRMREELSEYGVTFSNYEGGGSISTYLASAAEERDMEFVSFYAMVPAYDFSSPSLTVQQVAVEEDFKAWYDLMRRLSHMLHLDVDLSDLEAQGQQLILAWDARIQQLEEKMPELKVGSYMEEVNEEFEERGFEPLSQAWEDAVDDLF